MSKGEILLHESRALGEKYYEINHKSGLKIIVCPKKLATFCAIFGTDYGAADSEFYVGDRKIVLPDGTAHFLEHKLFESEDGVTADERFARLGAETNAYTSHTVTKYLFSSTKNFRECFAELLRFVSSPYFTDKNVKKEQGIIEQEIAMCDDDPYERIRENCMAAMFPRTGIAKKVCGTAETIAKITPEILYDAYGAFYRPENMILSVCGDVTPEEVLEICDREIKVESREPVRRVESSNTKGVAQNRISSKMQVARPIFYIAMKDATEKDGKKRIERWFTATILNNMLFSGTGELYNRMVDEGLVMPAVSFGYAATKYGSWNYFSGVSDDPERVLKLVTEKCEAAKTSLDERDFERCRRAALAGYIKSYDSTAEIADDNMSEFIAAGVDPFSVPDMIENMKFEDVLRLAKELFCEERYVLSTIEPL
ncbi:MAG: insulinase family protein [Clostridia bacterium]|nr:insulinase family protein [Clostridia bacterium]